MSKIGACVAFSCMSACSTIHREPPPVTVTATEVGTVSGSEPHQFLVAIEDGTQKWPQIVALEGKVATVFVGDSADFGRSVEVTCQGEWASVAVIDKRGPGNQELLYRFASPIARTK
ncbi:MAG: hypothetical protein ACK5S5_10765 [Planctomycetota bacterium]